MSDQPLTRCDFDSSDLLVKVDLTLPGDVNAISPVVERVMQVVTAMGCAAGKEFEIELALREALANAIEHGSGHDPSKEISAAWPATTLAACSSWSAIPARGSIPRRSRAPSSG